MGRVDELRREAEAMQAYLEVNVGGGSVDEYIEESGCDCVDIGVEWVYVGVYDDEGTPIKGFYSEAGECNIDNIIKYLKS